MNAGSPNPLLMQARTPITLVTGPLGSGKTTLLRHILAARRAKIAIVMNEFGEIGIDSKIIEGKSVRIAELDGGCVCCSLVGEFEAAVNEIIERTNPEIIVVETTGLAEPEALAFNIHDALPQCRIDGIVSVIDADMLVRFPEIGHTTRMQIEGADLLLLNKCDLVPADALAPLEDRLRAINPQAAIVRAERCRIDPDVLFGIWRERKIAQPEHVHQPEFESFSFTSDATFDRAHFEQFADRLPANVVRAKGFVRFGYGAQLFNFVAGRWDLEPFESDRTELVFIGRQVRAEEDAIRTALRVCET
jgi:G3E family GTPase